MLDSLACGSWLVYATRAGAPDATRIRNLILYVKRDALHRESRRLYAELVVERMAAGLGPLLELLGRDAFLIPVPGAGLTRPNTVWPALSICKAMHRSALGGSVATILRRTKAVHKSAGSQRRPSLQEHYDSFSVQGTLERPGNIVLVDDVVTTGTTLMAGARRLHDAYPRAAIAAFALARVQSAGEPARLVEPIIERVTVVNERCRREVQPPALPF